MPNSSAKQVTKGFTRHSKHIHPSQTGLVHQKVYKSSSVPMKQNGPSVRHFHTGSSATGPRGNRDAALVTLTYGRQQGELQNKRCLICPEHHLPGSKGSSAGDFCRPSKYRSNLSTVTCLKVAKLAGPYYWACATCFDSSVTSAESKATCMLGLIACLY